MLSVFAISVCEVRVCFLFFPIINRLNLLQTQYQKTVVKQKRQPGTVSQHNQKKAVKNLMEKRRRGKEGRKRMLEMRHHLG